MGKPSGTVREVEYRQNPKSNIGLLIGCGLPQEGLQGLVGPLFL